MSTMHTSRFRALAFAGLCAVATLAALPGVASAETETGDRPVIKVPRGGGEGGFTKYGCITCHMADGRGGQNEGGYGADLRVTRLSEDEIVQTVTNGRMSRGMPSFKGMIDEDVMYQIAHYIKTVLRIEKK